MTVDRFPWKLVTVDIDGTLTTVHGWERFAREAGRLRAYRETNRRFFAGEIGEDEHLRNLLELAAGLRGEEVRSVLESTPRLAGIAEAVDALHSRGAQVALLTHNPRYVCDWYQERFGFDDAEGENRIRLVDGVVPPLTGGVRADKERGLVRLLRRARVPRGATAHVGDSRPDALLFPSVGGGIALNSRMPEVNAAADLALRLADLRGLVPRLARLAPRRVVNAGPHRRSGVQIGRAAR